MRAKLFLTLLCGILSGCAVVNPADDFRTAQYRAEFISGAMSTGVSAEMAEALYQRDQAEQWRKEATRARFAAAGAVISRSSQNAAQTQWNTYQHLQTQTELRNMNNSLRSINNTMRQGNARAYGGYGGPSY